MTSLLNIQQKKSDYPVLKIIKKTGLIVLFISNKSGFCVFGDEQWSIGAYHTLWNEDLFEVYDGTVTLKN